MATKDPSWTSYPGLRALGRPELDAVAGVLERRALYRGAGLASPEEVQACERELAALSGRRYALLLNSGTSALVAALRAAGVTAGSEVVLAGFGWLTDISAILEIGAVPVLAPVADDLTVDLEQLPACFSEATSAVVPVHPCGLPADLPAILSVAGERGVPVVDDACQCLGGSIDGAPVGLGAAASILSFQAFKIVTSGEGGGLVTDDEDLYLAATRYHDAGLDRFAHLSATRYDGPVGVGLNLRMSEIQAAMLRVQLRRLPELLDALASVRQRMIEALAPWIADGRVTPVEPRDGSTGNGTFLLLKARDAATAGALHAALASHGVPSQPALEDRYHASPGWLRYLRDQDLPHRAIAPELSEERLARLLLLDVQPMATEDQLEALSRAARAS